RLLRGVYEEVSASQARVGDAVSAFEWYAGLGNYPTEWRHWSYGERAWALATGAGQALYGTRELDA
ncbi:hypothetical protein AB0F76_16860, partial [Streptomyces aureus]